VHLQKRGDLTEKEGHLLKKLCEIKRNLFRMDIF